MPRNVLEFIQVCSLQVHEIMDEDSTGFDAATTAVWGNAEVFDVKTERLFRYLQASHQNAYFSNFWIMTSSTEWC